MALFIVKLTGGKPIRPVKENGRGESRERKRHAALPQSRKISNVLHTTVFLIYGKAHYLCPCNGKITNEVRRLLGFLK